ncbi:Rieske [2Fe-2S] iron-sulfur domain-containing protein [Ochromonadaceae sp. CCMP2298]|nr:Rieske [2Fe-2S] iron-sulfur domain-containing protein [Ochromonadaceae sp. CCMP2298]
MPSLAFSTLVLGFAGALYRGDDSTFYAFVVLCGLYCLLEPAVSSYLDRNLIYNKSISVPSHAKHDERRFATYPSPIMNTWYHLLDSDEVKAGSVREFRALNRVFVLWRDKEGNAVCQDAFCIHLGANLAQGGKIVDGCLQCPFHNWKFAADGTVVEVPYLKNPQMCQTGKKLHTYPVKEWCGMIFVYFHADGKEPEFQLPEFVTRDMAEGRWVPFMKWDTGFVRYLL